MFELKRFRKVKKISQQRLAEQLGVQQAYLSAVERGLRPFPERHIKQLKEMYGDAEVSKYEKEDPVEELLSKRKNSTNEIMDVVKEYQARLDKKDEQIDSLIQLLQKEIKDIKSDIKKAEDGNAANQRDSATNRS